MSAEAISAYTVALGYVQSMAAMMGGDPRQNQSDDVPFFLAFHMLAGFATELYLKSYLYSTGRTAQELRGSTLRHNLSQLLVEAKNDGLVNSGADFLADYLSQQHASFEYRYMQPASTYDFKSIVSTFGAFSDLDVYVDTQVGASAAQERTPGGAWPFTTDFEWRLPTQPTSVPSTA